MYVTFKKENPSIGCQMSSSFVAFLIITFLITLIDAQLDAPKTEESESITIGDTSKRAGFMPSRGRRFWSIFDWDDNSGEKRISRFLPARGRKAGFLPSRGKKWSPVQFSDDYSYGHPLNSYENENYIIRASDDNSLNPLDTSTPDLTFRGKKAFHAMRGKKESDPYFTGDMFKKSRNSGNFFGMRG